MKLRARFVVANNHQFNGHFLIFLFRCIRDEWLYIQKHRIFRRLLNALLTLMFLSLSIHIVLGIWWCQSFQLLPPRWMGAIRDCLTWPITEDMLIMQMICTRFSESVHHHHRTYDISLCPVYNFVKPRRKIAELGLLSSNHFIHFRNNCRLCKIINRIQRTLW